MGFLLETRRMHRGEFPVCATASLTKVHDILDLFCQQELSQSTCMVCPEKCIRDTESKRPFGTEYLQSLLDKITIEPGTLCVNIVMRLEVLLPCNDGKRLVWRRRSYNNIKSTAIKDLRKSFLP